MTCYLHHFLRVHCCVHCGVHCVCTVRALSKHKHSAYFSLLLRALVLCCACRCCLPLGELVCPQLERLCEPWCFAAACALASFSARSWNTLVSFKGPCSISRYLQTFWGYRLQKSCLLVFWLSCWVAWNSCRICMFACMYVCMYVCMHVRTC